MKISKKYTHIGYSYPGVPIGWVSIVEKAIVDIERNMWVRWLPMWVKRLIHYLATDNSVVRLKYRWAYKLRQRLTRGQMVFDIKEKYATLRIYGTFNKANCDIIDQAEMDCLATCQKCGSREEVEMIEVGWVYNLCKECRRIYE